MSDNISRRHLTQGLAWSVPAVALASSAPSVAASGVAPCPSGSCMSYISSAPTYTVTFYDSDPGIGVTLDSRVQLNFGLYGVSSSCMPAGTTGFRIEFTGVTATDNNNNTWIGTNLTQAALNAYVWNLGGALFVGADFPGFAYNGPVVGDPDWDASHYLKSYAVTYKITYLKVLNNIETPLTNACPYTATITATPNATYIGGTLSTGL